MQIKDARTGDTIITSGDFILHREASASDWKYRQYGFDIDLPAGVDSILFTIINKEVNYIGNDWGLDDIEIRLCAPAVTLSQPSQADTSACLGTSVTFQGNYTDDGTFGLNLDYRWEYSATGDINNPAAWSVLSGSSGTSTSGSVNSTYTFTITPTTGGYYRLAIANAATINTVHCRAVSDMIHVTATESPLPTIVSDTTVCTEIIDLRTYVSTIAINNVIAFYADSFGLIPLSLPLVTIVSDTVYYVQSVDTLSGCQSRIQSIRITQGVNPIADKTTGPAAVCIGSSVVINNTTAAGGEWSLSNTSHAEITTATANSVTVKGLSEGHLYVSYTVGALCETRVTFPLKVIAAVPPMLIIGFEFK
jgi:hypothetical protein